MSDVPATFIVQRVAQIMRELGDNYTTRTIASHLEKEFSNYGLDETFTKTYRAPLDVSAGPNWGMRFDSPRD